MSELLLSKKVTSFQEPKIYNLCLFPQKTRVSWEILTSPQCCISVFHCPVEFPSVIFGPFMLLLVLVGYANNHKPKEFNEYLIRTKTKLPEVSQAI